MSAPLFAAHRSYPEVPLTDCHVHIGPSDTQEIFYPDLTLDEYVALMHETGIVRACLFAPLRNDGYRRANQALLAQARMKGSAFRVLARLASPTVPLTEPAAWLLRRKIRRRLLPGAAETATPEDLVGFDGVKLLPHLDGLPSKAVMAAIDAARLPLLVHGGDYCSPLWIEQHLIRHTRGPVIIAHLGSFPCNEAYLRDAVAVAARHEHVYLDTSGAWHHEYLRHAIRRVPQRILFGSDAPLMHPAVAWRHVCHATDSEALLERIGHGAADEIFGSD